MPVGGAELLQLLHGVRLHLLGLVIRGILLHGEAQQQLEVPHSLGNGGLHICTYLNLYTHLP